MNRRGFLGLFGAAIGGIVLEQAIPLGRVWSFPSNVIIAPSSGKFFTMTMISQQMLEMLRQNLKFTRDFNAEVDREFRRPIAIGNTIKLRTPYRYPPRPLDPVM